MKEFTDLKEAKPAKVQGSREKGQRSGRERQGELSSEFAANRKIRFQSQ